MAKIKIKDLPRDMKIGKDELKRIKGGADIVQNTTIISPIIKWETDITQSIIQNPINLPVFPKLV
jgi:hypothetical protein